MRNLRTISNDFLQKITQKLNFYKSIPGIGMSTKPSSRRWATNFCKGHFNTHMNARLVCVTAETAKRIAGPGMWLICQSELLVKSVNPDKWCWMLAGWIVGFWTIPICLHRCIHNGVTQLQEFDLSALPYAMDLVHCSRLQACRVHSTLGQIASARATSHIQYISLLQSFDIFSFRKNKIYDTSRGQNRFCSTLDDPLNTTLATVL